MKNSISVLTLILAAAMVALLVTACNRGNSDAKPDDVDYYTCTMHPSVRSQDPHGKCPICGMDLIPVKKTTNPSTNAIRRSSMEEMAGVRAQERGDHPAEFTVPTERQQQIGVTYAAIQKQPFTHTVRVAGLVAYDQQRHWECVTRIEGYVQKLFVFSPGELVEKGAPLLTLYSPDLLNTQNEFAQLLKTRDEARDKGNTVLLESSERLVESARQRLRLWNITGDQIQELEKTRQPRETLTIYSPFRGVVQDLGVEQGRRVMAGDKLVDIADLSTVWVWAQFYQDELPMLTKGLAIAVKTSSYPGEKFDGKISVIDPFINDALRTGRVRIDVANSDLKLRPNMYVDAELTMDMGEGLAVPVPAVLPTGLHNIVFVDKGAGRLEPRFVELGREYGGFYEVHGGLKEGERVVTSANFLIDAEATVQGALRSW
jgi:Cu(I)/Ag(I) efflux system membrane fusion protein